VTTTNYSYDDANQLTAVDSVTYTYDFNGNMTCDGSRNFEYDSDNRLVRVTNVSDGSLVASFEYDGFGRRTSKTTPAGTTKYYYDGDSNRVFYEMDGGGNLLVQYTYGHDGQLLWMVRGGQTYYYHYNGHGDVVALTDSIGIVVAEYDFDAWGNPVATGLEGTVVNPYRYAGYRWDAETGMYYLNARYYLPSVGRFITRDSFHGFEDEPQSVNLYVYTKNNPVNIIDPTGHWGSRKVATWALKKVISQLERGDLSIFRPYLSYYQYTKLNEARFSIARSIKPLLYYSEVFPEMIEGKVTDILIHTFRMKSYNARMIGWIVSKIVEWGI